MCCNTSTLPIQVASLFKPSSRKDSADVLTTHNAQKDGGQPLSYAEFVVQSKNKANERSGHGPQTGDVRPVGQRSDECRLIAAPSTDAAREMERQSLEPTISGSETSAVPGRPEENLVQGQKMDEGQSTEERTLLAPAVGSGNSIIVSPRQVKEHFNFMGHSVYIIYVSGLQSVPHI